MPRASEAAQVPGHRRRPHSSRPSGRPPDERRDRPRRSVACQFGPVRRVVGPAERWTLGLVGLLAILLVFTKLIQPCYGVAGIQGLGTSILPLALAAVAQAIAVIAGGIDLSIGSMMAFTSVVAAMQMDGQSPDFGVVVVLGVLLLGLVTRRHQRHARRRHPRAGHRRHARDVIRLGGLRPARPSGPARRRASQWLEDIVIGPFGSAWIPKAAVVLVIVVAVIWIPVARSRIGLSIYAVGSNQLAAFRSGVPIGRTKIAAYALTGLFRRWPACR